MSQSHDGSTRLFLIRVQISFNHQEVSVDKSKSSVMANHGQLLSPEAGYDLLMDDASRHTPDVRQQQRLEIL